VRTRWGGHIGWGNSAFPSWQPSWAEPLVVDFLAHQLNSDSHGRSQDGLKRVNSSSQQEQGGRNAPPHHPHPAIFATGFDELRSRL